MSESTNKKPMTDAERLELAAKLDNDLDEFINGLEKKRYTEGWPEDRWEEEMDKHPFFMKTAPKEGDELHPLLEGIQQLKYDTEENTKEDLASTYKDDGNFYVKHKKYRMAIYSYTEGIRQKCENSELNSNLYNNRSAAHFFVKNYRSSLSDALKAVSLQPGYIKPLMRAASCYNALSKFDECIQQCDAILQIEPGHKIALDLRKSSQSARSLKERDARKKASAERKQAEQLENVLKAIKARKVKFQLNKTFTEDVTAEMLQPHLDPLAEHPVHLDVLSFLIWPAVFCYPEFSFSDFQQNLSEHLTMQEVLQEIFSTPFHSDNYKADTLNVYFENKISGKIFKINVNETVKEIVSNQYFLVTDGYLAFYVVPKESEAEQKYVNAPRRPINL